MLKQKVIYGYYDSDLSPICVNRDFQRGTENIMIVGKGRTDEDERIRGRVNKRQ